MSAGNERQISGKRQVKRITRPVSAADREKYRGLRDQLEGEKEEILAKARRYKQEHDVALSEFRQVVQLLKSARQEQGLSLANVRDRSGLERSAVSRLENDLEANPTLATMSRYAQAVGKRIVIKLVDEAGCTADLERNP